MVSFNAGLFARDVRMGRARLALTLRELAKETSVPFSTIDRLERGSDAILDQRDAAGPLLRV